MARDGRIVAFIRSDVKKESDHKSQRINKKEEPGLPPSAVNGTQGVPL